jgi:hypothetical protein
MPDPVLVVPEVEVAGEWGGGSDCGPIVVRRVASLVLESHRLRLEAGPERPLHSSYEALTDATWSAGELALYWRAGRARVRGDERLAQAWAHIVDAACALPEVARGLRSLGTRRGGTGELQRRFFGPLLQARRRLREPDSLEWRLAHFDARGVRRRVEEALLAMARETFPVSPPDRRALEADLADASEALLRSLEALDHAANETTQGAEGMRFVAWRDWTSQLRAVFVEADSAWIKVLSALDASRPLGR